MANVSYAAAGTTASPAGSVSQVTVPWPSVSAGQLALLVVTFQFERSAQVDTPLGWYLVDAKAGAGSGGQIFVFSKLAGASESAVSVKVRSQYGDSVSAVVGRIFTFSNALRATKRGRGITIGSGNAGVWVTRNEFDDAGVTEQTIGANFTLGYRTTAGFYAPTQEVSSDPIIGIELENQAAPGVPTILSPGAGSEVSTAENVVFAWLHNGFAPQTKFKIRVREVGSGTWSYVKADGTLTTTETEVTSSQETIAVPAAQFSATAYEWSMFTFDGTQWSPTMPTQTFSRVAPPVVTVTAPSAPIVDDLTPTVTWSTSFTGARTQTAFRVTATGASGYLIYDSGVILGAQTSHTLPPQDDFTNGESVTFAVTVTQTGGSSGTGTTSQTVSWTPPADPEVAVADTAPGLTLTIGADVDTVLDVQRSADGSTWTDVATSLPVRTADDVVLHDVLAPYGVPVTYRVRASETLEGTKLATDWVVTDEATSHDTAFYLVDSVNPLNYAAPLLTRDSGRAFVRSGSVSYAIDGTASVDIGPLQGDSGEISVLSQTQAEESAVKALLTLNRPVWLRWPPDYDGNDLVDVPATRAAVTPDPLVHERRYQRNLALRDWPVKWVEQPLPTV